MMQSTGGMFHSQFTKNYFQYSHLLGREHSRKCFLVNCTMFQHLICEEPCHFLASREKQENIHLWQATYMAAVRVVLGNWEQDTYLISAINVNQKRRNYLQPECGFMCQFPNEQADSSARYSWFFLHVKSHWQQLSFHVKLVLYMFIIRLQVPFFIFYYFGVK